MCIARPPRRSWRWLCVRAFVRARALLLAGADDAAYYQVLTYPVSVGRALDAGAGAAFVYVLQRVDGEADEHWHVSSEFLRATGKACWRRWRAGAGLQPILPAQG